VLLLGLSTGHKVGLALAAAGFAGFSLLVSMLVPRWRPQFPGRGLGLFVVVCVLLFAGMVAAVLIFGKESEGEAAGEQTTTHETATKATTTQPSTTTRPAAPGQREVKVSEVEWKINLPKTTFSTGTYTFDVSNDGKVEHDLTIEGEGVKKATPTISGGKSAKLTVDLKPGTYDFFCAVPGHKQLGMDEKVTIS
jgi:uncharacterized cupredoxin-like copper-binding protein